MRTAPTRITMLDEGEGSCVSVHPSTRAARQLNPAQNWKKQQQEKLWVGISAMTNGNLRASGALALCAPVSYRELP